MKPYLVISLTAIVCSLMFCTTAIHITGMRISADRELQNQSSAELEKMLEDPQGPIDISEYIPPSNDSAYDEPVKVQKVP
jgi:hypothetical protein